MAVTNLGLYPCFDYYMYKVMDDKEKSIAFCKNMVRAFLRCGTPKETIQSTVMVQFPFSKAGMDFDDMYNQVCEEESKDCERHTREQYGESYEGIYSNFCQVCPACENYAGKREQLEYGALSRLLQIPYEDGLAMLKDKRMVFSSWVSLNDARIYGNKLERPCVVPLAQMLYECLMQQDGGMYRKLSCAENGSGTVSKDDVKELANLVIEKITECLGEKTFLNEDKGVDILCDYINRAIVKGVPMAEDVFGSFLMPCEDCEEEVFKESEMPDEMPDFESELAAIQDEIEEVQEKVPDTEETIEEDIGEETLEETVADGGEFALEDVAQEECLHDNLLGNVNYDADGHEELAEDSLDQYIASMGGFAKEEEDIPLDVLVEQDGGEQDTEHGVSEEEALSEDVTDIAPEEQGKGESVDVRLEDYPYFHKKVNVTRGGWLTKEDSIDYVPVSERRFIVPFAENDENDVSAERNMIVHPEITSAALSCMVNLFDDENADRELDALQGKVRKDGCIAVEVVYVTDTEEYILLIWNEATRRYNYVSLIERKEGKLKPIPYEVVQALKSEKRKVLCYQPYLLCGISGLYDGKIETKNVHSIYSHFKVLTKDTSCFMEDIFGSYLYAVEPTVAKWVEKYKEMYGSYGYLLTVMPFYHRIKDMQFSYAVAMKMEGLCASRQKKDIMYGYSYLAAGVYPGRQGACFKLLSNGQIVFLEKMVPSISYVPGYIMEFVFANIESDESEKKVEDNVKNNQKARRLLLKELARQKAAFYHGDLKLLYIDDYKIIFYVTHTYRAVHKTDITRILMHETYRHKISSNQLWAKFWGTSLRMVRYVNKH